MINLKFKNSALTTLTNSIGTSETSITVLEVSKLPIISSGEEFIAVISRSDTDYELVKVTSVNGSILTIVRAQEGTTAKSFESGTVLSARLTAGQLMTLIDEINSKPSSVEVANIVSSSALTSRMHFLT